MTIEEAMICLSIQLEVKHRLGKDYEANALQLGIKALKRLQDMRDDPRGTWVIPLPGETKE